MQDNSVKDTVKVLREWPMRDYITRCNSFGLIKCAADIIEQQEAELAALKEAQRWRNAATEPPQNGEFVWGHVVFIDEPELEEYGVVRLNDGEWLDDYGHSVSEHGQAVIEWMPLPAAPEEQKGE